MAKIEKASLESQLFGRPCPIADTEEMFWLRMSDDYQSKCRLASLLVGQYRYRDAIRVYEQAVRIRGDDPQLYLRLGGSYLTLFEFDKARLAYQRAQALDAQEKALRFPLGVWHYLLGQYEAAAERFAACLPCDNELKIAVLYWHMLSCLGAKKPLSLKSEFDPGMDVGHHGAYKLAVRVLCGLLEADEALLTIKEEADGLNYVIAAYGLAVYLRSRGDAKRADELTRSLLQKESVWPCIAYLAALSETTLKDKVR